MKIAIRVEGPVACGKTNLIDLLKAAVHRNYQGAKQITRIDVAASDGAPAFEELIMEIRP